MSFTYDQVTSISQKLILEMLDKGIFTDDSICGDMRDRQQIIDGGTTITAPLISVDDTGSVGGFYSSRDALSLDEADVITSAEVSLKQIYESVVIYKFDLAKNGGKLGVLRLIDSKVQAAQSQMKQRITKGLLSDGTSNQFNGAAEMIASSGTYAGIAPADLSVWASQVDDNAGVGRALTQLILDGVFDDSTEGNDQGPTHCYMRKQVFTPFKQLLTPFQRTTREDSVSGLGHKGSSIIYNGAEFKVENQMAASTIFGLDLRKWKLYVQKDNNMRRQSIKDLETADALLERIFLYANALTADRRHHFRINDINE